MFKFGLKNLRRLKDVPPIGILPITILVGRNSSGKSSYLRALPLLRQSIMTRTSSPILWFGDFVDFGSFDGSVSDNDSTKSISFSFCLDAASMERRQRYFDPQYGPIARPQFSYRDIQIDVTIAAFKDDVRIQSLGMSLDGGRQNFVLGVDPSGQVKSLRLNDEDILPLFKGLQMVVSGGSIFPDIVMFETSKKPTANAFSDGYFGGGGEIRALAAGLADLLSPHLDKRIKQDALLALSIELLSIKSLQSDDIKQYLANIPVRSWQKLILDITEEDTKDLHEKIVQIHTTARFIPLLRFLNVRLRRTITETLYIGPARARSERYYRYQDLAVSEIDQDGKNFAMFLNSLHGDQLGQLSAWIKSLFGYSISLKRSPGHISINLQEEGSETNIVDTGYGVSQILPVLGQIWWASNRDFSRRVEEATREVSILAIEQPELHLHPAHQAFLADALANPPRGTTSSDKGRKVHFIVETHSEALVNRLGELVAEGKLDRKDVQIVLFEPDEDDRRRTTTRVAQFGKAGELIDWPYGFFQPKS